MNFRFQDKKITGILTVLPEHEQKFVDDMRSFDFPEARSLKLKDPGAVKTFRRDLVVFPGPPGEKGGHKLAWRFILESKKPNP